MFLTCNIQKLTFFLPSFQSVRGNIEYFEKLAKSTDEQYAHITEEERQKVTAKCEEIQGWLDSLLEQQKEKKDYETPVVKVEDLRAKQDELFKFVFVFCFFIIISPLCFFLKLL